MNNEAQSTYRLLVRSEEKGRGIMETVVYALLAWSVVVSIWQFAQNTIKPATDGTDIADQLNPDCDGRSAQACRAEAGSIRQACQRTRLATYSGENIRRLARTQALVPVLHIERADLTMNERSFIFRPHGPNAQVRISLDRRRSSMPRWLASPSAVFTRPACTISAPKPGSASV